MAELIQITTCCSRDGGFMFKWNDRVICRKCHTKEYYYALKTATKITLLSQETIDKLVSES